jgi:hypothetical protein
MSDTNSTPRDFYVYLHRKATTGEVFYVGKGHGRRAWHDQARSKHWQNIVRKHGIAVEVVQNGLQEWAAHELERDLIALHGRSDCGYGPLVNLTDGGEGTSGFLASDAYRAKHTEAVRKRSKDPNWRRNQFEAAKKRHQNADYSCRNAEMLRKMHEDLLVRQKRASSIRIRDQDPEYKARHAEGVKKTWEDPSHRAKMAESNRKARSRKVLCIETGQVFLAGVDAANWLRSSGISKATMTTLKVQISNAASGKRETAYGLHWKFADAA